MSRGEEMQRLTEDLRRSHEERVADQAVRRADLRSALEDTRRQVAAQRALRMERATVLRQELGEDAADRGAAVARTLADHRDSRAEAANRQRSALASATASRRAEVQEMRAQTQGAMREAQATRMANGTALKAELSEDRADLFRQVDHLLNGIYQARTAMATRQRADLAQGHAALQAEVADGLSAFRARRVELSESLAEIRQVWQSFDRAMQGRRLYGAPDFASPAEGNGPSAPPTVGQMAAPIVEVTVSAGLSSAQLVPPAPVQAAASPSSTAPAADTPSPPSDHAVFSHLADHPDGVRLVELEEHFGVSRIRLVPIVGRLIEEGKARKEDERKLYFAT